MIPGTVYTLEREGQVLGTLTVTDTDRFAVHGTFDATPAFAPYRALFEEEARLSSRLAEDESLSLLEKAEDVLEEILALGLVLRRSAGTGYRNVLISIEGTRAGFRPLSPEEEPL
ncbi:hypothetical protein [Deinococcus hohokamensis]|uniref:Uncharacterized protein n=1 Tax=Deinococcus hohokamensis TaxID=309883 RepID=A0ABV9I9V4_9DEIO